MRIFGWPLAFCALGWHPREGRMMRPLVIKKRRRAEAVAEWTCGNCLGVLSTKTRLDVDVRLLRELRQQVPEAREKSKIVNIKIVRRGAA